MVRNFLILLLGIGLLTACGPNYVFDEKYDLENTSWSYSNTLDFDLEIEDTLKIYNIFLEIQHSKEYAYQNLYTKIHTAFPSGESVSKLVSLELADQSGFWYGKCGGDFCTLKIPIQEGAFFNALGQHSFKLEQFMRIETLAGVKSAALKVEDTGQRRD